MSTPNTERTYASRRRNFENWCATQGVEARPCTTETFTRYVTHLIRERQLSPNTVETTWYAIRTWQPDGRWVDTSKARALLDRWKTEWRAPNTRKSKADPITSEELRAMLATCANDPVGLRDGCLLTLAWGTANQREELARCTVSSVRLADAGVRVRMPGAQTSVLVRDSLDPATSVVRFTSGWLGVLDAHGSGAGLLFRPIDRWGNLGTAGMSTDSFQRIVQRRAKAAGLDSARISFRSLRMGGVTVRGTAEFSEGDIEAFGRWRPPAFAILRRDTP
jgi:site-specific recombinase XerD